MLLTSITDCNKYFSVIKLIMDSFVAIVNGNDYNVSGTRESGFTFTPIPLPNPPIAAPITCTLTGSNMSCNIPYTGTIKLNQCVNQGNTIVCQYESGPQVQNFLQTNNNNNNLASKLLVFIIFVFFIFMALSKNK